MLSKAYLEALSDIDLDALLDGALEDLIEHDVCNHLHLALGELPEDDDLIYSVQELWPAVPQQQTSERHMDVIGTMKQRLL